MDNITFCSCSKEDLNQVQKLVDDFFSTRNLSPDIALTFFEFERYPEKGRIVVIKSDQKVIGYAVLVFFWSNEYAGNLIEIDELVIEDSLTGQGIGKKFFSWLELAYPKSKAHSLHVSSQNKRAEKLYKELGFKPFRDNYLIKILDSSISGQTIDTDIP